MYAYIHIFSYSINAQFPTSKPPYIFKLTQLPLLLSYIIVDEHATIFFQVSSGLLIIIIIHNTSITHHIFIESERDSELSSSSSDQILPNIPCLHSTHTV